MLSRVISRRVRVGPVSFLVENISRTSRNASKVFASVARILERCCVASAISAWRFISVTFAKFRCKTYASTAHVLPGIYSASFQSRNQIRECREWTFSRDFPVKSKWYSGVNVIVGFCSDISRMDYRKMRRTFERKRRRWRISCRDFYGRIMDQRSEWIYFDISLAISHTFRMCIIFSSSLYSFFLFFDIDCLYEICRE